MKSRTERDYNKMKKQLEENNPVQQQSKPLTAEQVLVKLVIDSQNNINRLAVMQEQQMVYINTLFKQVIRNESTNSPSAGTTAAVSTQTGTINHSSQPSDNQSVTEENKTL
jgi:hypothetical protein